MLGYKAIPTRKEDKKVWLAPLLHLFWVIWKEKNIMVFENATLSSLRLKASFLFSLRPWVNYSCLETRFFVH